MSTHNEAPGAVGRDEGQNNITSETILPQPPARRAIFDVLARIDRNLEEALRQIRGAR